MTESTSDEVLMSAYQAGNQAAFTELYERHGGSVYGFLARRLSDRALVDDLYQEVFLRMHRARNTYDSTRPFRAWLFGIVHHLLVDTLRNAGRTPRPDAFDGSGRSAATDAAAIQLASPSGSPEEHASAREIGVALGVALRALPSDEATVLLLARMEGLSYDDIGLVIGRSAAATKQLAYRALKRVRAEMVAAGYGGES